MHSQGLLLSLLAVGAMASPLVERDIVYEHKVVTRVITVGAAPTHYGAPKPAKYQGGHRHHHNGPAPSIFNPPEYEHPKPSATSSPNTVGAQPNVPASGNTYQDTVILHHNAHRANHSAPNIAWDAGLASTAQKIADTCVYAHNTDMDGGGYGQNIAAGIKPADIGSAITDGFYNGEVNYYTGMYGSEPSMSNFEHWGHFSQIVWKSSTSVGCATCDCSGKGLSGTGGDIPAYFTVCNYKGPGNFAGEYAANVLAPKGKPSISGTYSG